MKIKRFLQCCTVVAPACFVIRLLQYFTVITKDGYFVHSGILSQIMSWSVYVMFAVAAVFALIITFAKPKVQTDFNRAVGGKGIGFLFIIAAVFIMISSGIQFMSASYRFAWPIGQQHIPDILKILSALLGVLTAIYYALLGISKISDAPKKQNSLFAIVAPLYFAFYGICEFYTTFESAGQSETKIFMLSVCMLALFSITLALAQANAEVYDGRLAGAAGLLAVFTAVTGPAFLIATLFGRAQFNISYLVHAFVHTAFMLIAFVVLVRLGYAKPTEDIGEIEPIEFDSLDKYINEIPDEDRGNNEQ